MYLLRRRYGEGEQVKVLPASVVSHLETSWPLPEVVILGADVMYEVLYDATGTHSGARRIDDPAVVSSCGREISEFYEMGEDLQVYFDREIAPLPPPD